MSGLLDIPSLDDSGTAVSVREIASHHESWLKTFLTLSTAGIGFSVAFITKTEISQYGAYAVKCSILLWVLAVFRTLGSHHRLADVYLSLSELSMAESRYNVWLQYGKSVKSGDSKRDSGPEEIHEKLESITEEYFKLQHGAFRALRPLLRDRGFLLGIFFLSLVAFAAAAIFGIQ